MIIQLPVLQNIGWHQTTFMGVGEFWAEEIILQP